MLLLQMLLLLLLPPVTAAASYSGTATDTGHCCCYVLLLAVLLLFLPLLNLRVSILGLFFQTGKPALTCCKRALRGAGKVPVQLLGDGFLRRSCIRFAPADGGSVVVVAVAVAVVVVLYPCSTYSLNQSTNHCTNIPFTQ